MRICRARLVTKYVQAHLAQSVRRTEYCVSQTWGNRGTSSWQRCAQFSPPANCRPQSHRPGAAQLLRKAHSSSGNLLHRQSILSVPAAAAWAFARGDGDSGIFVVFGIIGVAAWVFKSEH